MAPKKRFTTNKKPWDSTPKRGSSTRYVKHDSKGHFTEHSQTSGQDRHASTHGRIIEMPPPGPSNIVVTTANPLPAPKKLGSK